MRNICPQRMHSNFFKKRLGNCQKDSQALYAKQHEAQGLHWVRFARKRTPLEEDLKIQRALHGFSQEDYSDAT